LPNSEFFTSSIANHKTFRDHTKKVLDPACTFKIDLEEDSGSLTRDLESHSVSFLLIWLASICITIVVFNYSKLIRLYRL